MIENTKVFSTEKKSTIQYDDHEYSNETVTYYRLTVEDIFGNPDYGTEDLCDIQIGLTGIFAFLLGYELGLPEMFDTTTGDPGIGYFGSMCLWLSPLSCCSLNCSRRADCKVMMRINVWITWG